MKFYFDENLPKHICYALQVVESRDGSNECLYIPDVFQKGEEDEVIMDTLSTNKGIYVTQDSDFRKIQLKYDIAKQKNVGLIHLKSSSKKNDYWEIIRVFFKHWIELKKTCKKSDMPFYIRMTSRKFEVSE